MIGLICLICLNVFAIIFCLIAIGIDIKRKEFGWGIVMVFCLILNVLVLFNNVERYKNPNKELQKHNVKNVVSVSIDTTTVINKQDTTVTYNITYWK